MDALSLTMANSETIRKYATRLLALALKAREQGRILFGDELTDRATHYLDRADALEAGGSERGEALDATLVPQRGERNSR